MKNSIIKQLDSAAVSIFVVILIELTNTAFVNSTKVSTNIETAVLAKANSCICMLTIGF